MVLGKEAAGVVVATVVAVAEVEEARVADAVAVAEQREEQVACTAVQAIAVAWEEAKEGAALQVAKVAKVVQPEV